MTNFDPTLEDEFEIADYIEATSVDEVDTEMLVDYFRHCYAELDYVPIDSIQEGDPDTNLPNEVKQKRYLELDPHTMPPIVVDNNVVVDGNHRYRAAKELGMKVIPAYIVKEIQ